MCRRVVQYLLRCVHKLNFPSLFCFFPWFISLTIDVYMHHIVFLFGKQNGANAIPRARARGLLSQAPRFISVMGIAPRESNRKPRTYTIYNMHHRLDGTWKSNLSWVVLFVLWFRSIDWIITQTGCIGATTVSHKYFRDQWFVVRFWI